MSITTVSVSGVNATAIPVAVDTVEGDDYQLVKLAFGTEGKAQVVDETHGLPVEDVFVRALLKRIVAVLERIESKL